ncbi:MAG: hypothetical protein HC838_18195 [Spirulinaceae cyanobacterium RM2_2_10]|nr:hypothetical protein [Spirulinaceae cyanobacterium RM2_2_10]
MVAISILSSLNAAIRVWASIGEEQQAIAALWRWWRREFLLELLPTWAWRVFAQRRCPPESIESRSFAACRLQLW